MWFYGCLKGLSEAEVKAELDTLLDDVGLLHKRHEQTKNLSGKRTRLALNVNMWNSINVVIYIFLLKYKPLLCVCQVGCRGSCLWQ